MVGGLVVFRTIFVSIFVVTLLSACGGGGAVLRDPSPVYVPAGMPMQGTRAAIIDTLPRHHWQLEGEQDNHLVAALYIRSHVARVFITYDAQAVWIQYADSQNLSYRVGHDGSRYIHPNYNRWVGNLARDLQRALPLGAQASLPVIVIPVQ